MGKRLIIKGADFTENGMKVLNYVSNVYTTERSQKVKLIGNGCAITSIPNNNVNIMVKFKFSNNDTVGNLFECYGVDDPYPKLYFGKIYNSQILAEQECEAHIYNYSNNTTALSVTLKKDEIYTIDIKASEKKIIINGEEHANVIVGMPSELDKMIISGGEDLFRIMEFKYYTNNGNVLMHLLPIKDDDDVPCLYDTITKTNFYPSGGTLRYEA